MIKPAARAFASKATKRSEIDGEKECFDILQQHFVLQAPSSSRDFVDAVAERPPRDYIGIIYKETIDEDAFQSGVSAFANWKHGLHLELAKLRDLPQLWLIGRLVSKQAKKRRMADIHVFSLDELRKEFHEFSQLISRHQIARSVAENREHLLISCDSLGLLIEEKLSTLRHQRPNSASGIAERDDEIEDLVHLKRDLRTLKSLVASNKSKKSVEESVISFSDGVQRWWNKHHDKICARGFDLAMFLSAVSVCSLAGAGGPVAAVVSGALVGGKSVADALKAAGKRLWK